MPPVTTPDDPPQPAYGWLMVSLAALGMVATLPGRTHGLGMITERLLADSRLGLDRVEFGQMNLWATLLGALFCLACGPLVDRLGARRVMTAVVLLLGLTVLAMCRVTNWWSFFVLLTLTRGLGQSALSVVALTLVGKWFRQRLSLAMAAFSVQVSLGFMLAFGVYRGLHAWPWTSVWASLGWLLLLGVAPVAWLLVRDGPAADKATDMAPIAVADEADWTLAEALATPAFWVFGLATSVYGLIASGTSLFAESILTERGLPATALYEVGMVSTLVGLASNFAGGYFARGNWLRSLTAAAMLVLGLSLAALPQVRTTGQLYAYAVGMGIAGGMVTVVFFTVWGRLFGRAQLGRIQGAAQMLTVVASALGPQLMAQWHQQTRSYVGLLYILSAVVGGLCLLVLLAPLPHRAPGPASIPRPVVSSGE